MNRSPRRRVVHVLPGRDRSGLFTGLARHRDRSRFDVAFWICGEVDPRFAGELDSLAVPVVHVAPATRRGLPRLVVDLVRRLRRGAVDLVHGHLVLEGAAAMAAARLAGVPGAILTRHHSDYHLRAGQWRGTLLDRGSTALAHRVIAVSEHTRRVMVEREGAPPEKVRTIPNGVDAARIPRVGEAERRALRAELGMGEGCTVVQVGRLHEEKGYDDTLAALALLRDRGCRIRLVVVGSGPAEERYRALAAQLGLGDRVTFLGYRRDAVAIMSVADGVLLPSRAEAFGLVAVEALAAGAPVVAAAQGGLPEVVAGRPGARLVPPGDAAALATAVAELCEARVRGVDPWGPPPGRAVLDDFSLAGMVARYEALYDEVLT